MFDYNRRINAISNYKDIFQNVNRNEKKVNYKPELGISKMKFLQSLIIQ